MASSAAQTEESTPPERPNSTCSFPHLIADLVDQFFFDVPQLVVALGAADPVKKVVEDLRAFGRVFHFRVELYAVESAFFIHDPCVGAMCSVGDGNKALRQPAYLVRMAHQADFLII